VAIWQQNKRVLSIFSPRMRRNGYFGTSGQKSDPAIRSGDLDFPWDRCTSTTEWRLLDIFDVFVLLRRMTLWPWPSTFWPWECFMYSASHVWHTYRFLWSYDYRLLSYDYWISGHISVIWNSHCACAVSRDLCIGGPPKQHVTIFWHRIVYSLYNFYGATMTIKGSFILEHPHVKEVFGRKKTKVQSKSVP